MSLNTDFSTPEINEKESYFTNSDKNLNKSPLSGNRDRNSNEKTKEYFKAENTPDRSTFRERVNRYSSKAKRNFALSGAGKALRNIELDTVLDNIEEGFNSFEGIPNVNYVRKMLSSFDEETIEFFVNIFLFVYRVKSIRNMKDLLACAIEFVQKVVGFKFCLNKSIDLYASVKSIVLDFIQSLRPKTESEFYSTLRHGIKLGKKHLTNVVNSTVFTSLKELVLRLVGLKYFTAEHSTKIVRSIGTPVKGTFLELLSSILTSLEVLFGFGEAICSGKSANEIFSSLDRASYLNSQANDILLHEELVYTGIPVEGKVHIRTLVARCKETIAEIENALLLTLKTHPSYKTLNISLQRLKVLHANLRGQLLSQGRITPYAVIIHGKPGCGKSSILSHVSKVHSRVMGRKFENSHMFNRNTSDQYWSGYEPESQPYIHYSELGSDHINIVKNTGDPILKELLSVIDSVDCVANMADLGSKGNTYIIPEGVFLDLNDPEMNVKVCVNNPAAVRRRFIYIEVMCLKEWSVPGTSRIDSVKVSNAYDTGLLKNRNNVFKFNVYRMEPINLVRSQEVILKREIDIYELSHFLNDDIKDHVMKEKIAKKAKNDDIEDYFTESNRKKKFKKYSENISFTLPCGFIFFGFYGLLLTIFLYLALFHILCNRNEKLIYFFKFQSYVRMLKYLIYHDGYHFMREKMFLDFLDENLDKSRRDPGFIFINRVDLYKYFQLRRACIVLATGIAASIALRYWAKDDKVPFIVSEGNRIPSDYDDEDVIELMSEIEKETDTALPPPRKKKNEKDIDWDINIRPLVICKNNKTVVNNSCEELLQRITGNIRLLTLDTPTTVTNNHAFGIKEDILITNKHFFQKRDMRDGFFHVEVSRFENDHFGKLKCMISYDELVDVTDDLVMFRVFGLKVKDLISGNKSIFPDENVKPLIYGHDGFYVSGVRQCTKTKVFDSGVISGSDPFNNTLVWTDTLRYKGKTKVGDCGKPIMMKYNRGVLIVAFHVAGQHTQNGKNGIAMKVNTQVLKTALAKFKKGLLPVCSEGRLRIPEEMSKFSSPPGKSPVRFEKAEGLNVHGQLSNYNVSRVGKSSLKRSPFFPFAKSLTNQSPFEGKDEIYLPPLMRSVIRDGVYISPYNEFIKKAGVVKKPLPSKICTKITDILINRILKGLNEKGVKSLSPVPLMVAQNGFSEDFYMRSMKNSTSGGFLWPGSKGNYVDKQPFANNKDAVKPKRELVEQVLHQIKAYQKGEDAIPLLGAQLKDEPRSREKVLKGKTRVFAMSSYESTLVQRMYLLPFYTLMIEHQELFCSALGINMHSEESNKMIVRLINFSKLFLDGDFGGFDTSMPLGIPMIANTVVYRILESLGYNEHALDVVKGILSDNLMPMLVFQGLVVSIPGFQPSGKYATAEDNTLRNLIILLLSWTYIMTPDGKLYRCNKTIKYRIEDFFSHMLPYLYGDDVMGTIKKEVIDDFNSITISEFCTEILGMKFTASDKSDNLKKFGSVKDVSFLKRNFVYRNDLKRYVAPLDRVSVMKTIAYTLPSKSLTEEEQMLDTMISASREMFFHLEDEEFESNRQCFIEIFSDVYDKEPELVSPYFPTFYQIKESIEPVKTESNRKIKGKLKKWFRERTSLYELKEKYDTYHDIVLDKMKGDTLQPITDHLNYGCVKVQENKYMVYVSILGISTPIIVNLCEIDKQTYNRLKSCYNFFWEWMNTASMGHELVLHFIIVDNWKRLLEGRWMESPARSGELKRIPLRALAIVSPLVYIWARGEERYKRVTYLNDLGFEVKMGSKTQKFFEYVMIWSEFVFYCHTGGWTPLIVTIRGLLVLKHHAWCQKRSLDEASASHWRHNMLCFTLAVLQHNRSCPRAAMACLSMPTSVSLTSSLILPLVTENLLEEVSPQNDTRDSLPNLETGLPVAEGVDRKINTKVTKPYIEGNVMHFPLHKSRIIPEYISTMDLYMLKNRQDLLTNVVTKNIVKNYIRIKSAEIDKDLTVDLLQKREKKRKAKRASKRAERGVFTESSRGDMEGNAIPDVTENVTDIVGETTEVGASGKSEQDVSSGTERTATIAKFLERPVKIYDSTWSTATDYNVALNPWDLWSLDNSVRAKLSNYAYIKGTLVLKISVSGTPFHYGKLMLSYQALADANDVLQAYDDLYVSTVPTLANLLPCYKTYLSQSPYVTYLDVGHNQPIEMRIPMILPKNRAKLYNTATTLMTAATSYEDFANMGELRIVTLNHIVVANEDYTSTASIHVSARMEDIELGALTATNINVTAEARRRRKPKTRIVEDLLEDAQEILAQDDVEEESQLPPSWWSRKTSDKPMYNNDLNWKQRISQTISGAGDEYQEPGPVASVATAVSKAGEALSDVPIIGGFAKATSSVAKGIGKVASWFGFSKPVNLEKTVRTKRQMFANGAFLSGDETVRKLSCDPKQELAIDQSFAGGSDKDCMAIKEVISREAFIHTFSWDDTSVALTDVLWESMLMPFFIQKCNSASSKSIYQPTPLAWVASLFSYWRGSVTFRFEIVASKFHRGKMLFRFEPNAQQIALISADGVQLNQQNVLIVDIQETQNIELTVGYVGDRTFKTTRGSNHRQEPTYDSVHADVDPTNFSLDENFGMLQVYTLNELQQPTDAAIVYVNVYVKSNDMEFAVPHNNDLDTVSYTYTETESKVTHKFNEPLDNSNVYLTHFGEKVESLRSLLKRYTTEMAILHDFDTAANERAVSLTKTLYPTMKTHPSSGTSLANSNANSHLFNYLRFGYLGMRGGYRYRFYWVCDGIHKKNAITNARLVVPYDGVVTSPSLTEVRLNTVANAETFQSNLCGAVKTHITGTGTEIEIPFYSSDVFHIAFSADGVTALGYNMLADWTSGVEVSIDAEVELNDKLVLMIDSAPAEDFTFLHFNGAPFYVNST